MKKVLAVPLLLFALAASAAQPYRDYLPNLPAHLTRSIESDAEFFSQKRDEEAFFFAKASKEPYEAALRAAAGGSKKHLAQILASAKYQDGAGAESYADTIFWLMHKLGDESFSSVLLQQSKSVQSRVIGLLDYGAHYDYSSKFPKTFRVAKHAPL